MGTGKPAFLMCPPKLYDVNYVINPWMEGNIHRSSREHAAAQWEQLHAALSQIADVLLVEPQPGSPDMVFTANAGLVRDGIVALSSFHHPERQGEEPHFRKWFSDSGFSIREIPRATPFEGEGDALFDAEGSRLWAGHGLRTRASSHRYLTETWAVEVLSLGLIDPRFYHLDTCFCPLSNGDLMYYPPAFDSPSRRPHRSALPGVKPHRRERNRRPPLRLQCRQRRPDNSPERDQPTSLRSTRLARLRCPSGPAVGISQSRRSRQVSGTSAQ